MFDLVFSPVQTAYRWLDENPGSRLALALTLFAVAILAPIPGWMLDLWLISALGGAAVMAILLVVVGSELEPREALAGLPAFLRRFAFQRLALALALTKAVFLGHNAGALMDWLGHRGLGGSVGVGLAAVAAIYAARFASAHFPHLERLQHAAARLPIEIERAERAIVTGRLSPAAARTQREALSEELEILGDARQIFRMLRQDAWLGLTLAICLLAAGLITGLVFKGWPWALTLSSLTLFGLAEATFTALPGLIFGVTLSQWLGGTLEEAVANGQDALREAPEEHVGAPLVAIELGRELMPLLKRGFPELVAATRMRIGRELGFTLPRIELAGGASAAPRGFRILVRGVQVTSGELREGNGLEGVGDELLKTVRLNAAELLTLDAAQRMLDELAAEHPIAVAHALERLGLPRLHGVMKGLLRERVSLQDLSGLVEALVGHADDTLAVPALIELVRKGLALPISLRLADEHGMIHAFELGATWDDVLTAEPDAALVKELVAVCRDAIARHGGHDTTRALIVPRRLRSALAATLVSACPTLQIIASDEIAPRCEVLLLASLERPGGRAAHRAPEEAPVGNIGWKPPLSILKSAGH